MDINTTSPLDSYFKENKVEIVLFPEKTTKTFRTLKSFIDYMKNEKLFWQQCNDGPFAQINQYFANSIGSFINAINPDIDDPPARSNLAQAVNSAKANKYPCVYSETKAAKILKEQYLANKKQAYAALAFISNNPQLQNTHNLPYDTIRGVLDFYMLYEGGSKVKQEASLFIKEMNELKQQHIKTLTDIDGAYNEKVSTIDKAFVDEKLKIEDWSQKTQSILEEFITQKQTKLVELEKLYTEKLRLEGPAKYWKKYSEECEKKGEQWRNWSILTAGVIVLYLTGVLFVLPESLLWHKKITTESITSMVVFALIVSFFVYINRLFVKLSLSSYHLFRDAKERHELIYLFLSLLNEDAIKPEDRNVILTSLFSRAETGLLKGDSSPEMPEGIAKHITKNITN